MTDATLRNARASLLLISDQHSGYETGRAMTTCTNPAHSYLNLAPIPCPDCRGWLDGQGAVMSTREMLRRYPQMAFLIRLTPPTQLPDYQPTRGERILELNRLGGKIARTLLAATFALLALLVLAAIIVAFLGA